MKQIFRGFVWIVLACLFAGCTDDDEYTQGQWIRRSDFDGVARCNASSFTIDNKGYLCCGYRGSNRDLLKDCWAYDIEGNYWTQCADMPDEAQGRHGAAAFALNGKGYVTTGALKDEPNYLADTWEYDPATDQWTQKDDFAGGMRYGALGFSVGGYGYVGTGYDDNYLKDFYRFDPNAASGSQWQIVNGFEGSKRVYGMAFVIDDAGGVWLRKVDRSIWRGLWTPLWEAWPASMKRSDEDEEKTQIFLSGIRGRLAGDVLQRERRLPAICHDLTHRRLLIEPHEFLVAKGVALEDCERFPLNALPGMPKPVVQVLSEFGLE